MTRKNKNEIKNIDFCLNKIAKLSLLKEQDKSLLKNRLLLLKKLANKKCFSDDNCEFQIVIYSYSIMEFLAKKYFKINSESYFDIDFNFLPHKIYKKVDLIRKYRNHVHIKAKHDTKVSSAECISSLKDIFKYFTKSNSIAVDIVLLLVDVDLNNKHDVKLLKSLNIPYENFSEYINTNNILCIPKRQIKDCEYSIALEKYTNLFFEIFKDEECTSYSYHLIGRFLYSLTFFKTEDTKSLIKKSLEKNPLFLQVCNDSICYVVELFPEEIISYLKDNIKSFSKTFIKYSNLLDSLLYSLVVSSNDDNIEYILYFILVFYDISEEEDILKRASDMLWPERPQTKASLDKQFNAVFKLFSGSNNLSHSTIFSLLLYLLKGFKKNYKTYLDFNNNVIGLFEDGKNHEKEVETQYERYYNFIFKKAIKFPTLLHILLCKINSFDKNILYKLLKDINSRFKQITITFDVLRDLKTLYISLDRSEKGYNELNTIIKVLCPELIDNKCIEIVNHFNNFKTLHPCFSNYIKKNTVYYITEIINLLDNPYDFGALISQKYKSKFDIIVLLFLGRKQDKILSFIRGFISHNYTKTIDKLFLKANNDLRKLNLLLLCKFDLEIYSKLIKLKRYYRNIYWQNFNSQMINPFLDLEVLKIIIIELINIGNFVLALEIVENNISLNEKLSNDASLLSLSIKLLYKIANNFSIDIKYNWDIDNICQNAKIHNKITSLLDIIEKKVISFDLFKLEYIFAERRMEFNPISTGYYLRKSPHILKHLFENKNLIALLDVYWDKPPGFSKSNRFYVDKFNKWFCEYEKIKSGLTPNDIKKVSFLLCHSYANGPFLNPRKEIINKLNEFKIDWNYFAFTYIEHLKTFYEIHINSNGFNDISLVLNNFLIFLKKNNFNEIANIIRKEGKEFLNKKIVINIL